MIIEGPGDVHSPIVGKANLMPEWFSEKCQFIQVKGPIQAGKYSRETASDWDSLFHLRNFVLCYLRGLEDGMGFLNGAELKEQSTH